MTITAPLRRLLLAFAGAFAGAVFYALVEANAEGVLSERALVILMAGLLTLFGSYLAMSGPIGPRAAALRAVPLGGLLAGLMALVLLRYPQVWDLTNTPMPTLALFAVAVLPVPFLIAGAGPGWRDYPALFHQGWSLVVRGFVASVFTGVVWLVLWLCDSLLQIVGVRLISVVITSDAGPYVLTGGAFGLGVAVVDELSEHLSPRLVLRLLRLLLPVFVVVATIFLVALAFRGFGLGFGSISAAATLLAMAAAGVTLVAAVADASDAEAAGARVMQLSARAMAVIQPVLAGLALWALGLRVGQYGWTPERLFVAVMALLALAYGLTYAIAVLRGAGWMARVRAANPWLALGGIAVALLWLTPAFNPEAISARDQRARFLDGRTAVADLDVYAIGRWGKAGAALQAELRQKAEAEGNADLLARLDGQVTGGSGEGIEALRAEVLALLPVQPESAAGTRAALVGLMEDWRLIPIRDACKRLGPGGEPGCVMVVADLLASVPGEEAVTALDSGGWVTTEGFYLLDGVVQSRSLLQSDGLYPTEAEGQALLRAWQAAPPPLAPVPLFQLGTGPAGVFFLP